MNTALKYTLFVWFLLLLFILVRNSILLQNNPHPSFKAVGENIEYCATNELLRLTPELQQKQQQIEQRLYTDFKTGRRGGLRVAPPYVLPVVVHIIHQNGVENIADAQVLQGIADLNEAFANTNYYDQNTGVNTQIQFCLATQTPNGSATTGIDRITSPLTNMTLETQDAALKNLIRWDPMLYINIWLVAEICSDALGCGVAGYASLPFSHGGNADGIVEEARHFGASSASSTVQVHEMGHYLGLYHTFQGACSNNDCMIDGDRVCDTPPDNSTIAVPCGGTANSCSTDADSGFSTDQNDQFWNYMDYGDRACYSAFTDGQKERMHWYIENVRFPLLTSRACNDPCTVDIMAAFLPDEDQTVNIGTTLNFTNTSTFADSYEWQIDGIPFATSNNTNYTFNTLGTYEINLFATNTDPNCFNNASITVNVVCPVMARFETSNIFPAPGEIVSFTNESANAADYDWQINGVSESDVTDFSYVFPSSGAYTICLKSYDGACEAIFCQTIFVANTTSNCTANTFVKIIGEPTRDETGYTIIPSGDGNLYIGGRKGKHLLLTKVDTEGEVIWQKKFITKIAGSGTEIDTRRMNQVLLDTDGMLLIAGYGILAVTPNDGFVLKYDPIADSVVWIHHFRAASRARVFNIVEPVGTSDYYIITGDTPYNTSPGNGEDAFFAKIDRNTGLLVDSTTKSYTLGVSESFNAVEQFNGELYIAGRYTNLVGSGKMRFSLTKMDLDGNEIWSKLYHKDQTLTARLYAQDLLIEDQSIFMIGYGDDEGASSTNIHPFFIKTDMDGNIEWMKKYNIGLPVEGHGYKVHEIVSVADGFLILGSESVNKNELYLLKTDKNGIKQWVKTYIKEGAELYTSSQSQLIIFEDYIYIIASIKKNTREDILLIKTDLEGNTSEECIFVDRPNYQDPDVGMITTVDVDLIEYGIEMMLSQNDVTIDTSLQYAIDGCECAYDNIVCETTFVKTIGTADRDESGRKIIAEPNGGFLISASNGDSTLLLLLDAESEIIWQRAFNFLPTPEQIKDMFIDSDGYLVGVGFDNDGAINYKSFVFKYDYINDNMLWAKEMVSSSLLQLRLFSIVETSAGSNYFISGSSANNSSPGAGCDGLLLEVDRATGDGLWYNNHHLGSCEDFFKLVSIANSLYTFGRNNFADGGTSKMRAAISQFDLSGNEIWSKLYLVSTQQNARLYAVDAVSDNGLACISHGSLTSINIDDFNVQLFKTDYTGNIQWAKNYNIAVGNERESAKKILNLSDGYLILGEYKIGTIYSIFIMKTDKNGVVEWTKKYGGVNEDKAYDLLYQNGLIYLLGGSATYGLNGTSDILLAKLNLDGSIQDDCMISEDLIVVGIDINNPYDGDHALVNYPISINLATRSITTNETVLEEQLECYVPCLQIDTCLILPDATIVLSNVTCLGDSLSIEMEVCNLFNGILPQGTPISFYDENPSNTSANLLTIIELNQDLLVDECIVFSKKIPTISTANIYAIVNDGGTNPTPFDLEMDLPNTPVSECDFLNNISQIDIVYAPPILDLGPDTTLCDNATLNFDAGNGFYGYNWFDGSHGQTYTAWGAGTYWVEAIDSCGGVQIDSIIVTILPESRLEVDADTIVCPGATISISVDGFDEYQWFPVDKIDCDTCSTVVVTVDTSLMIEVVGRKAPGCFSVDTIMIDVFLPIIAHDTLLECEGNTAIVFGQPQTIEGDYTQIFMAMNGCDSIHTTSLFFTTDTIFTSNNLTICQGDSIEIFGQMETQEGVYTQVNDSGSCVKINTIDLEVYPNPDINLLAENISCFGEQDGQIFIETSEMELLFSLDDEDYQEESVFNFLSKGNYELYVQTIDNCIFNYVFSISEPDELLLVLPEDQSIHLGDSVHVLSLTNGDNLLYIWSPLDWLSCLECLQPFAKPLKTTVYTLNITDQNGCTAEDEILIEVDNSPRIYIPNVFSPNADGVNDVFFINANNDVAEILKFQIFDRWGELVFEEEHFAPNHSSNGWNGQFKGAIMESAVFVYYAEVLFIDGRVEVVEGDVLLLR